MSMQSQHLLEMTNSPKRVPEKDLMLTERDKLVTIVKPEHQLAAPREQPIDQNDDKPHRIAAFQLMCSSQMPHTSCKKK